MNIQTEGKQAYQAEFRSVHSRYSAQPHSEILYLGSHRCCSFILLSLHLQDGTASLYTIVIFVLSMFFHLFYVLSLAVFLFQIYTKKKILRPSCVTIILSSGSWFPWILVLSLFLLWLILRVLKLLLLELD